ncbi:MAG: DoxX family protein [Euryarchaeota archaeon]|nr:DoxX family protein [Euryarchaeota archaeon]
MQDRTRARFQGLARAVAVGVTFVPALGKFAAYSQQVAEFQMWGIPNPELLVPITGVVQFIAMFMIAVGFAGRYGATALAFVMVVAMSTAGPSRLNIPVFVGCLTIVTLGTGPYSLWDPSLPIVGDGGSDRETPT